MKNANEKMENHIIIYAISDNLHSIWSKIV